MTKTKYSPYSQTINLEYIRAAIQANTGITLPLDRVREYLVEEGLITPRKAERNAQIFRGYSEFFEAEGIPTSN